MGRGRTRASQISDDNFRSEVFIFDRDEDADHGHRPHLPMGPTKNATCSACSSSRRLYACGSVSSKQQTFVCWSRRLLDGFKLDFFAGEKI
jgi:hypothetical protein